MPIEPHEFAKMLGAEIVGEVPDVGGGPFGMARLAHIMQERLKSSDDAQSDPIGTNGVTPCEVPISDATLKDLANLARQMSTKDRQVTPMQVAGRLLEEAVALRRR